MSIHAVIDCGTNSIKFHVAERRPDGTFRTLADRAEVSRLGEGLLETGAIAPAAVERSVAAIAGMVAEARRLGADTIDAVGTMGMRAASNAASFLARVEFETGVAIEVISGEEEGRLAYVAVQSGLGLGEGRLVILDTGGGSTQFTFGHGTSVDERFSLDIGAVRLTAQYGLGGALTREAFDRALEAIAAEFAPLDGRPAPDALVGMGGAITNMTAVMLALDPYDPDRVQGATLTRAEVERQLELYRSRDVAGRREIVGLQPKRADVILAGACVVWTVMNKLGRDRLTVSDRGLRHGLVVDRYA